MIRFIRIIAKLFKLFSKNIRKEMYEIRYIEEVMGTEKKDLVANEKDAIRYRRKNIL